MSHTHNLPKRIIQSLAKIEKKIVSYPIDEKLRRFREKYQDQKENRELLVVDKYGNRYYQYYSYHGLPTRRVVLNNMKSFNKWDDDPFMLSWLQRRRQNPPTQEELERMYIEQEEFQRRGLEWDRKEQAMIDEWKRKQKEALDSERKETKAIGEGETFSPGVWDKNTAKIDSFANYQPNQLIEVKEEEKRIVEGASTIPGKYIMEFREEDEKWMERRRMKMIQPYVEFAKDIVWTDYTFKAMNERYIQKRIEKKKEIKEKQQELTNIGKKMLEKKQTYQRYSQFRERFNDVFKENEII
jgi:hypothetical protein